MYQRRQGCLRSGQTATLVCRNSSQASDRVLQSMVPKCVRSHMRQHPQQPRQGKNQEPNAMRSSVHLREGGLAVDKDTVHFRNK